MLGMAISCLIIFFALIGLPLFLVLALAALSAFSLAQIDTSAIAVEIYKLAGMPTLVSIPLFTFAGYLLADSKSPQRLLRLAEASLGSLPGGVAWVTLIVSAFFTAFTGASGVTIIALGGLLLPILLRNGHSEKFSLGLITTTGSLGLLFPPSLPLILYGLVAQVDISVLFKAGILPGIVFIIIFGSWCMRNGNHRPQPFVWSEFVSALRQSIWEVILPIVMLVGIYGGFFTVNELATLAAAYVIIIECFVYKDLKWREDIPRIVTESMSLVGGILLILCCALALTNYLVDQEVPDVLLSWMKTFFHNKYMFLLCLNIFLLIVGCLMDIFSAIVVVVPLILPVAKEFGIHPVHLAIIFLANLEIGYITPPVGLNLFIASFRFKKSMWELYRASLPFLLLSLLALALITYVPYISLATVR